MNDAAFDLGRLNVAIRTGDESRTRHVIRCLAPWLQRHNRLHARLLLHLNPNTQPAFTSTRTFSTGRGAATHLVATCNMSTANKPQGLPNPYGSLPNPYALHSAADTAPASSADEQAKPEEKKTTGTSQADLVFTAW